LWSCQKCLSQGKKKKKKKKEKKKKKKKKKRRKKKKKKKKKKKRPKVKVKTEEIPKVVVTTDLVVESSVQPKQEESKDADNEAHTDQEGGNKDGIDNDDCSSDDESISSSDSSNSDSSSSIDESSVYDGPDTYTSDIYVWRSDYAEAKKNKRHIEEGNMKLYYLFLNQCSPPMVTELKSTDEFEDYETNQDGIGLLGLIREVMCGVEKHLQSTWALVQANKALYTFWQQSNMPNDEYLKLFNSRVTVLETLGGRVPVHDTLVLAKLKDMGVSPEDEDKPSDDTMAKAFESAQKEYLALLALSGANGTRFGGLRDKLENQSLFGNDNYPKDQAELLHLMNKYKPEIARIQRNPQKNTEELAFDQAGGEKEKKHVQAKASDKGVPPGTAAKKKSNLAGETSCFHCSSEDHCQYECPKLTPA
jgi:hypothetical protein